MNEFLRNHAPVNNLLTSSLQTLHRSYFSGVINHRYEQQSCATMVGRTGGKEVVHEITAGGLSRPSVVVLHVIDE